MIIKNYKFTVDDLHLTESDAALGYGRIIVSKKNVLARFMWGGNNSFDNFEAAKSAAIEYISNRKDADKLRLDMLLMS
tara:strand:- start:40 stop:273 length:234 start_codon:yes stop_codon:yes gene_type:complete